MAFWHKKAKVKALEITDQNYNEVVLKSDKPILLDFWGAGCGPCNVIGPFIDNVAQKYDGKALVGKVLTNANPILSQHFKIRSVPTLLFFHNGELVEKYTGLVPQPNLERILESYVDGSNGER